MLMPADGFAKNTSGGGNPKPDKLGASSTREDVFATLDAIINHPDTPDSTKAEAQRLKEEAERNWESLDYNFIISINFLIDEIGGGNGSTKDPVIIYTIQYNANGGTQNVNGEEEVLAGESTDLPGVNSGFSRPGYVLIGWNTQPDGKGTNYNLDDMFTPTGDITRINLYAMWQELSGAEPPPEG